jgi:hypothetical protein
VYYVREDIMKRAISVRALPPRPRARLEKACGG